MMITLTPEMEQAVQDEARHEARRQNKTPEQLALDALLAGLRNRPVPQTLDDIKPRVPLPAGKTLRDLRAELGEWPGEETDAELLAALKAGSN